MSNSTNAPVPVVRHGQEVLGEKDTCTVAELEDAIRGFVQGDLTLAQLEGFTAEEIYSMADVGHDMLQAGNLQAARSIFEGLRALNPNDPYFHVALGSIAQRSANYAEAIGHYRSSVKLYSQDAGAWTNLGESLLLRSCEQQDAGQAEDATAAFEEALDALARAIALDPDGDSGPGRRARVLVSFTAMSAEP